MKKAASLLMALILVLCFGSFSQASDLSKGKSVSPEEKWGTEINSMKTGNSSFYKAGDGRLTAVVEVKNETPSATDNNLTSTGAEYQNNSSRFKVKFPKQIKKEALTFSLENTGLTFELQDSLSTTGYVYGDTVKYTDIMQGTDLVYQVLDSRVKETVVLKDSNAPDRFTFKVNVDNLSWTEKPGGRVDFASRDNGKSLFYFKSGIRG